MWLNRHLPLWAPEGAAGSGTDAGAQAGAAGAQGGAAGATGGAASGPWHAGIDADTVGFWQNKGYAVDDPKALASELTKQYRQLESHLGAPADQLLKMPKADAKPEDIKAFRMKLGMPAEPKDYDFSTIKDASGNPLPDALADTLRNAAHTAGLSKEAAATVAAAVAKQNDDSAAAAAAVRNAKITEEKADLRKQWGDKFDFNHLKAMEGAQRLGITPEAVKALENQIGYAGVMEAMRKIGAGTSEDTFVDRGARGGNGSPVTREGAVSRRQELMNDRAWGARYVAGDAAAKMEMDALNIMIDGEQAA